METETVIPVKMNVFHKEYFSCHETRGGKRNARHATRVLIAKESLRQPYVKVLKIFVLKHASRTNVKLLDDLISQSTS